MTKPYTPTAPKQFSLLQGILPIRWDKFPNEIIAGVTLAALAIPEVMGYTKIAGTPIITGLYTILLPTLLFALFGSSRHLVVGADSATAAMLTAGLTGVAVQGSPHYVALAGVLALLVAGYLLVARYFRLGFLANFLSRTVLIGFLTGVGIQVALGQVHGMLGIHTNGNGLLSSMINIWQHLHEIQPYALGLSLAVIGIILGSRYISRRLPGPLMAIAGAIVVSWAWDLKAKGVVVVGEVPGGMPTIGLPGIHWSWELVKQLVPIAFGMFIVILAQSAATSRAYADRYNEHLNEDVDLVGLSLANIGAALTGTFVVNGSPTKTQMIDSAGGRTQLAQLASSGVVILVLLFLTKPLAYLPESVLAAVVFLIGVELIDTKGLIRIYRERPYEFWVALITVCIIVCWGVEPGILVSIFLSLLAHTRHGYRPINAVLQANGEWEKLSQCANTQAAPGLIVYHVSHSMYYANCSQLEQEVRGLISGANPPLRWFCIDCVAVDDIDFSAAEELRTLAGIFAKRNIRLIFTEVADEVRDELERSGITNHIGEDAYFTTAEEVVAAYKNLSLNIK